MIEIRGRRLFALLAPLVIGSSAFVGAVVGANAAQRGVPIRVFDLLTLPSSGVALGFYAALWAAVVLGALYGLVALASRLDDAAV